MLKGERKNMKNLTVGDSKLDVIISKAGDVNSLSFRTIDDKALAEIASWMPEVNRATSIFGKRNSQATSSLMSLNMIDSGTYRVLRQILAQVEKKRGALKENIYEIELKKIEYEELRIELGDLEDDLELKKLELKKNKIATDIIDGQVYIEGALKELGALKRRYEEICKNKNIPENWSEIDFEKGEIEHHIKSIFRNAIRDQLQGSCNMGTMEYMEQYGINPITAYAQVRVYIDSVNKLIANSGIGPSIESHYQFYESMYQTYKDDYKRAMKKLGLDSIIHADFLMKG